MTKEEIHDEQIAPLMAKIIDICKEHKIAALCSFSLGDEEEGLCCTTALPEDEYEPPTEFISALRVIRSPSTLSAFTITRQEP